MELIPIILQDKKPVLGEIELTLFENCHLNCSFCHHDKDSTVGMTYESMLAKLSIIEDYLKKHQGLDLVQINVVGGELFQDRLVHLYEDYYNLFLEIKKLFISYNQPLKTVWVTSMQFSNREAVKELLYKLNTADIEAHLIASYDFKGRPVKGPYAKNIDYFKDYICSINMVATVDSINAFLNVLGDPYFHYLYETFDHLYFDDYIPDKGEDHQIPSDSLFLSFLKHVRNFPKIGPYNELLVRESNDMHCLSLNKITIFPDDTTSNCRWDRYTKEDFITPYNRHDNAGMMARYIDENGCFSGQGRWAELNEVCGDTLREPRVQAEPSATIVDCHVCSDGMEG